jgi:hypothetical protein
MESIFNVDSSSTWATTIRTGRSDFSCVLVSFQNGVLQ